MSRPVKNLRFMGRATNEGARGKNQTPKGTQKAYGGKTESKYGTTPIGPNIERASQPRFDGPNQLLNKYAGY